MAVSIDATVGGASSNSYVTAAEATAYLNNRLNSSAFSGASTDDQARALIEATRELGILNWSARKTASTQALEWPRYFAVDPDAASFAQWYFASDVIPQRVKDATCELALEFLKAGTTDVAALDPTISVLSETVGPISTTYAIPSQRQRGISRFPRVYKLIAPMLDASSSQPKLVRG